MTTINMEDVSRYLFLASAVAGRRVTVHLSRGRVELACSDGQSIMLPAQALQSGREAWEDVVAQAALIGVGSLDPRLLRKLVGRTVASRRYAYLEVRRAARLLAGRLPSAFLELAELKSVKTLTATAEESLAWALSRRALPEPPACFGTVRPLITLRKAVSEEGMAAVTKKQAQGAFTHRRVNELDDEENAEESKILRLFQNPLMKSSFLSNMLNLILGAGSSRGNREKNANEGGGAEMPVGRVENAKRRGLHAVLAMLPFELPEIDERAETPSFAYPEWDVHRQTYRPTWAIVEEVEAWRPDGPRALGNLLKPASRELRRQLGSLGLDYEMHRRQQEGADLDTGRLIDCAIDLSTGHSPVSLDVYRASRRTRRDLAVAIMLDISGSTGEQNAAGESVFDKQIQVAYHLGKTLNDLGDTVAVLGFHSWGRHLVRAVRLKGAEEHWSALVSQRFAQLEPVGYTRTGAAIRHGERVLRGAMRLPNRLLIVITDGIAYDQDYESTYAEADARKALEEARASGTACVCLCVGGSADTEKLRAVFGAANLLIVDEPHEITRGIRQVCRQALTSVSQRKFRRGQDVA